MQFKDNTVMKNVLFTLFLLFSLLLFAACSGDTAAGTNTEDQHTSEDEHTSEEENGEHEHEDERIPNPDGAAITLLFPSDGDTFFVGDEIPVEVQVDNFALGEDGNHWHVYVDGTSWGMVMGGNTTETLRGLEAGQHEIDVFIAGGDHIDFREGDSVTITVEE